MIARPTNDVQTGSKGSSPDGGENRSTQSQLARRYETDALLGFGREGRWLIVQWTHRIALRRSIRLLRRLGFQLTQQLFDFLFVSFFHRYVSELKWATHHRLVGL